MRLANTTRASPGRRSRQLRTIAVIKADNDQAGGGVGGPALGGRVIRLDFRPSPA